MDILKKLNNKKSYGVTHRGKVRQNNEDYIFYNEKENIYIVADGMGGHNAGEVASEVSVKFIEKAICKERLIDKTETVGSALTNVVQDAHKVVVEKSKSNDEYRGMGCTLSVVYIDEANVLHSCHVGDSRTYLITDTTIEQLGTDHSVVAQAVKNGQLTEEQARSSNLKHRLTMAIGAEVEIIPEYVSKQFEKGNKLLICSDGLWDMLSDGNIHKACVASDNPKEICKTLLNEALEAGGLDNVSIIVVVL